MTKEIFNKLIVYIVKERDILDLVENDLLISEDVKKQLYNLIEVNFNTFVEFLYVALSYYYLPTCKNNSLLDINSLSEKDIVKVDELMKFVSILNDVHVLDIYDYLYTLTNIDELSFNTNFYDFIGEYLNSRGVEIDYIDEYFYILKKIFDIFLLNTIFNVKLVEKSENLVFGVNLYTNKNTTFFKEKENSELHLIVFNN